MSETWIRGHVKNGKKIYQLMIVKKLLLITPYVYFAMRGIINCDLDF